LVIELDRRGRRLRCHRPLTVEISTVTKSFDN
jgi:hypothetical protein